MWSRPALVVNRFTRNRELWPVCDTTVALLVQVDAVSTRGLEASSSSPLVEVDCSER